MKKIFLMLLGAVALVGCKTSHDQNPHVDIAIAKAPVVTPSTQNVITLYKYAPQSTVMLQWQAADYGYSAAVKYSVEIDNATGEFIEPVELGVVNDTKLEVTVAALNDAVVNRLKMEPDSLQMIKVRIVSYISDKVNAPESEKSYSPVAQYYVKTYQSKIIYPSLGMVGNFQGWDPAKTTTRLWSLNFDDKYEGWIMLEDPAGVEFKFAPFYTWKDDKGGPVATVDANGVVTGVISGGDNIKGVPNGYYKANVDWKAEAYTLTPIPTWGIIGDATPNGWTGITPMTYDKELCVWTITATLTNGHYKFRAGDDGWTYNFGVKDGKFVFGGDNMPISAGTYKITLNLNQATPTYTVEAQ